ncbi:MAG: HlyD family efflux transporter periplasmic adaptor subunit [Proteobacteria bacterium]|nr:HlyD family efflux transporter periplasmic adaptor subunit [Pseudomonadota bacterium]MDA0927765.1 HlyD family efflux transporter periplasmic adaptor subunit [Pseudomonadota bacterium]
MKTRVFLPLCLGLFLAACEEQPLLAVGQLESDRVEIITESNEVITEITVTEGDSLQAGQTILQQDASRLQLRIEEAQANIMRIEAQLQEQLNGPRQETIDATRASLQEAVVERDFRARDLERLAGLRVRNLTSVESVDNAERLLDLARARVELVGAQLAELVAGTRPEQIEQTEGILQQARTQLLSLELDRERLTLTAPVAGLLDSLPFEVGERPRLGDIVAVMLTGEQAYARIYIPEPLRVTLNVGSELQVHIDGIEAPVAGRIRRITAEPVFTPYFALTERDRSRLAYLAEVTLPATNPRLPEGLPVQVFFE